MNEIQIKVGIFFIIIAICSSLTITAQKIEIKFDKNLTNEWVSNQKTLEFAHEIYNKDNISKEIIQAWENTKYASIIIVSQKKINTYYPSSYFESIQFNQAVDYYQLYPDWGGTQVVKIFHNGIDAVFSEGKALSTSKYFPLDMVGFWISIPIALLSKNTFEHQYIVYSIEGRIPKNKYTEVKKNLIEWTSSFRIIDKNHLIIPENVISSLDWLKKNNLIPKARKQTEKLINKTPLYSIKEALPKVEEKKNEKIKSQNEINMSFSQPIKIMLTEDNLKKIRNEIYKNTINKSDLYKMGLGFSALSSLTLFAIGLNTNDQLLQGISLTSAILSVGVYLLLNKSIK